MIFLARFILKGASQAALVATAMAILGLVPVLGLLPALISGAAIALVTLAMGYRQGLMVTAFAVLGSVVFGKLIFSTPLIAFYFVFTAWLPVWMTAAVLRQTVSLALSLQFISVLCLLAVVGIYVFFPGYAALWQAPFDQMMQQFNEQLQGQMDMERMRQIQQWLIRLLPGLLASSILFTTMMSLFLARWWQAVVYNPSGFAKEFQSLQLGKLSALVAMVICAAAIVFNSDITSSMLLVVFALYLTQGASVLHAVFASKQLNAVWLYLVYFLMLFIPHIVVLLALMGLADAWIDFRRRLAAG